MLISISFPLLLIRTPCVPSPLFFPDIPSRRRPFYSFLLSPSFARGSSMHAHSFCVNLQKLHTCCDPFGCVLVRRAPCSRVSVLSCRHHRAHRGVVLRVGGPRAGSVLYMFGVWLIHSRAYYTFIVYALYASFMASSLYAQLECQSANVRCLYILWSSTCITEPVCVS